MGGHRGTDDHQNPFQNVPGHGLATVACLSIRTDVFKLSNAIIGVDRTDRLAELKHMGLIRVLLTMASTLVGILFIGVAAAAAVASVKDSSALISFIVSSVIGALFMWPLIRTYRNRTSTFAILNKDMVGAATNTVRQVADKTMVATKEWADKKAIEAEEARKATVKRNSFIESVKHRVTSAPLEVIVLGGSGWESEKGNKFLLSLDDKYVYMSDLQKLRDTMIDIDQLIEMEISGPGKVSSDAGVMGGGFGAEGALKGIAIATVINILTSHSSTKTFIRLSMRDTELVMLTSKMEPDQAKLMLSPIGVRIRKKSQPAALPSVTAELQKLHDLKVSGVISDEEFSRLKENLIRNGV